MKKESKKQYMKDQNVNCPKCKNTLSNSVMREYFGSNFIDDLNEKLLEIQILQDPNMVKCTCKNYVEVVPGSVDYKQKDEEGNPISKKAAEHMAQFRVRCPNCNRIFCSKCNADPYHIGKT